MRLRLAIAKALAIAVAGCGGGNGPSAAPAPVATIEVPADWVVVSGGAMQLTLPPWLVVFDNVGAIFANEAPPGPGEEIPMQLMAIGPGSDGLPRPGENLGQWIEGRLRDTGQGVPAVTRIDLPAGPAVRYDRTDRDGTAIAWRILAFVIETPTGVAYLQFDGPPGGWAARAADLEKVALLFRVRQARP